MPSAVAQLHQFETQPIPTNDFFDTTAKFASEKPWDAAKTACVAIDLLKYADCVPKDQEEAVDAARYHLNLVKLSKAPADALKKGNTFRHAVADFFQDPSARQFIQVFRDGNSCVGPAWDHVDFATKAFNLNKDLPWVQTLKGVNGASLIFSMGWSICEGLEKVAQNTLEKTRGTKAYVQAFEEMTITMMKLAKDISTFATGVLLVLSVFFGHVFAPIAFTALSATSVAFTILDFYYQNWGAERKEI